MILRISMEKCFRYLDDAVFEIQEFDARSRIHE
jgi:hypothetical protein